MGEASLRVRWLGRVSYTDANALQHSLARRSAEQYLLLLEHNPVYTLGVRTRPEHVLGDLESLGAEVTRVDRGGDITYHGPGQLVGYPILSLEMRRAALPSYVARVEELVISVLERLGITGAGRIGAYPGVWIDPEGAAPRKICAVGVRVSRGRTMHGFALNVDTDLSMFDHIVPCGITGLGVTSLREEGIDVSMRDVVDVVSELAPQILSPRHIESAEREFATDPARRSHAPKPASSALERRLVAAGVDADAALSIDARKPSHLRVEAKMGGEYLELRRRMRALSLVTVCEEAGCPNIYECWADGTATFMINGERCTRSCGFCLVDTAHPLPLDAGEPARVAQAVGEMHLAHAVVTAVARDDLADGGADAFSETIASIRRGSPETSIEVLIPDLKGDDEALRTIFDARPDVLNHNLETVLRLQRAVRPSASYARSLSVLARAKDAGLRTKSGVMVGLGETPSEVHSALFDLAAIGVDIVTIGQYLRPSIAHLPVSRYLDREEFDALGDFARALGFSHVESSPLTRSSYHARQAVDAAVATSESA